MVSNAKHLSISLASVPEVSGNFIIRFLSDVSVNGRGFVIRYTLALPSFATTPTTLSTGTSTLTSSVSASTAQCNPNSVCINFCEGGYVYVSRTCYTCTCVPVSSSHLGKCGSPLPCPCLQYRRDEQECPVCLCRNPPSNLPTTGKCSCAIQTLQTLRCLESYGYLLIIPNILRYNNALICIYLVSYMYTGCLVCKLTNCCEPIYDSQHTTLWLFSWRGALKRRFKSHEWNRIPRSETLWG